MSAVPQDPLEDFLRFVRQIAVWGQGGPDFVLYERLKQDLNRKFPGLDAEQYQRAVAAISKATGV